MYSEKSMPAMQIPAQVPLTSTQVTHTAPSSMLVLNTHGVVQRSAGAWAPPSSSMEDLQKLTNTRGLMPSPSDPALVRRPASTSLLPSPTLKEELPADVFQEEVASPAGSFPGEEVSPAAKRFLNATPPTSLSPRNKVVSPKGSSHQDSPARSTPASVASPTRSFHQDSPARFSPANVASPTSLSPPRKAESPTRSSPAKSHATTSSAGQGSPAARRIKAAFGDQDASVDPRFTEAAPEVSKIGGPQEPMTFGVYITRAKEGASKVLAVGRGLLETTQTKGLRCAAEDLATIAADIGDGVVVAFSDATGVTQAKIIEARAAAQAATMATRARVIDSATIVGGRMAEVCNSVQDKVAEVRAMARAAVADAASTSAAKAVSIRASAGTTVAQVGAGVREAAADKKVQATAASAAGGAVALGATGGATGLTAGGAMGAAMGLIGAPFTLGLSIPIGALLGGGTGLVVGTAAGATAGAVGGGAAGYGGYTAYAKREEIKSGADIAIQKVSSCSDFLKDKASYSAGVVRERAAAVRARLPLGGAGGTGETTGAECRRYE
mmetsp:Transcript_56669/g.115382  ORF Transcript_56669/g.115382 Transcript_56669/m.115382 type:complete len:554 (-) Transcript_56669:74-1735(-)